MAGLMYIGAFLLLLLAAWSVGWLSARWARGRGLAGWKVGVPVFLAVLLLVFWDWLPMEIMFRYDCSRYSGFTQDKTLEQWKVENPGVAETLVPSDNLKSTHEGNRERYQLNQRFSWDIIRTQHWFHIREQENRIVDTETGEVLARHVDFDTDIPPFGLGIERPGAYKLWMMKDSCEAGQVRPARLEFNDYFRNVKNLGRVRHEGN